MSRYQPLADFLSGRRAAEWHASFAEIERHLGFPLPERAHRLPDWWANELGAGHSQARGWQAVGWRVASVDLESKRVRFERESQVQPQSNAELQRLERLIAQASALTGIMDRAALVREGLQALVAREVALRQSAEQPSLQPTQPVS